MSFFPVKVLVVGRESTDMPAHQMFKSLASNAKTTQVLLCGIMWTFAGSLGVKPHPQQLSARPPWGNALDEMCNASSTSGLSWLSRRATPGLICLSSSYQQVRSAALQPLHWRTRSLQAHSLTQPHGLANGTSGASSHAAASAQSPSRSSQPLATIILRFACANIQAWAVFLHDTLREQSQILDWTYGIFYVLYINLFHKHENLLAVLQQCKPQHHTGQMTLCSCKTSPSTDCVNLRIP